MRPKFKTNGGSEEWRVSEFKMKEGEKCTIKPKPIYIYPESFLILLMGPDIGAISEGSTRHVQHGVMVTPGLDFDQSDMDDP